MNKSSVHQWASAIHHLKTEPGMGLMPPAGSLLKATTDPHLKLALQLHQFPFRPIKEQQEEQIVQLVENARVLASNSRDQATSRSLLLKAMCIQLNHHIHTKHREAAPEGARNIAGEIQSWEEMRFSLKCLFGTPSLLALTAVPAESLKQPLKHTVALIQLVHGKQDVIQHLDVPVTNQSQFETEN